jgi:hypothetical protein
VSLAGAAAVSADAFDPDVAFLAVAAFFLVREVDDFAVDGLALFDAVFRPVFLAAVELPAAESSISTARSPEEGL